MGGVLLVEARNINVVALYPWLMLPVVPVILVVLAFNFLGDGLRDAADPYTRGIGAPLLRSGSLVDRSLSRDPRWNAFSGATVFSSRSRLTAPTGTRRATALPCLVMVTPRRA